MPLDGTNFQQQDDLLDVLHLARERIARPLGWARGFNPNKPGVCALIALSLSTYDREIGAMARDALQQALPHAAKSWCAVIRYNDAPGRTQADIVALFDRAIAMVKEEYRSNDELERDHSDSMAPGQ